MALKGQVRSASAFGAGFSSFPPKSSTAGIFSFSGEVVVRSGVKSNFTEELKPDILGNTRSSNSARSEIMYFFVTGL